MAQIRENIGKKGKTYTARVRTKGKEVIKTFRRKSDASAWARKQEADFEEGKSMSKEARNNSVNSLFARFLDRVAEEKPKRFERLKTHLTWWATHIGHLKLIEVEAIHICEAREGLLDGTTYRGTRRSTSTANRYMSSLRQAFEFGVSRLHWLKFNVVKQIRQLEEPPPPERFLEMTTEFPALAAACAASRNKRLLPLFMLAVGLGLRRSSLVGLHEREVDLENMTIRIPGPRMKNGDMLTLKVSKELAPYLIWLNEHRNRASGLLFPGKKDPTKPMSFENAWKYALKRAGISDFRFHDNRHTAGTYFTEAGFGLVDVAALLGQKTLAMALRYAHTTEQRKAKVGAKMAEECLAQTSQANEKHLKPLTTGNNQPAAQ